MRLDPTAAAAGFRLLSHDALASTNEEALTRARSSDEGRLWIVARTQTAGRGRRGSQWMSPPGNLYATLLLTDPAPPKIAPQLSFVAGLAVLDAITVCAPVVRPLLTLKWPNDILCGGKKLAGILIEGEDIRGRLAAAIGIGLNCVTHPAETVFPATDLAAVRAFATAADLFAALSATMLSRLEQWRRGAGFAATRTAWLERAAGLEGDLLVRLPGGEIRGRCEALDESGRIMLRLADGSVQAIAAGDVFPIAKHSPGASSTIGQDG